MGQGVRNGRAGERGEAMATPPACLLFSNSVRTPGLRLREPPRGVPAARSRGAAGPEDRGAGASGAPGPEPPPRHVLIVDDHPDFLAVVRDILSEGRRPLVLATASSGEQALDRARHEDFDLVLMDLAMPGIGGLAATEALAALAIPPRVVVMTGHQELEYRQAAERVGADGFLLKDRIDETLPALLDLLFLTRHDTIPH